jgi:hypothetical protein
MFDSGRPARGVFFLRAQDRPSRKDWEGVGVIPDLRVDAEQALDEALKLAPRR